MFLFLEKLESKFQLMKKKKIKSKKVNDDLYLKYFFFNFNDYEYKVTIILLFSYIILIDFFYYQKRIDFKSNEFYDVNFDYSNFERNIITEKMIKNAEWQLTIEEVYFINGLIRKNKPKNCLEIGVASGGSSILILNAIKDFSNSFLVSLDLNTQNCKNHLLKTGYKMDFFPELANKWSLYTGDLPSKFLDNLNKKFDFAFIDSAHESPGEILNLIEILPFLNEHAIIVVHDIFWHFNRKAPPPPKEIKFSPSCIYLMSILYGDKVLIKNKELSNIGAVFLYKNQKNHYLDYFLLLNGFWEYMPTEEQINNIRKFIKKYYKNDLYLKLFDNSVYYNKIYIEKFKKFIKYYINK